MFDQIYDLLQTLALVGGSISLIIWSVRLGKTIGYIMTLLEIHTKEIEELKESKVDKDTCEAYRSNYG